MRKIFIALLLLLPLHLLAQRQGLVLNCTFDDSTTTRLLQQKCCDFSEVYETDTTRFNMGTAMKFLLNNTDPLNHNGKRSELSGSLVPEKEGWYGYSFYVPDTYVVDPIKDLITQFHNILPDTATEPSSPPLTLRIQKNRYFIQIQWSAENDGVTHDGSILQDVGEVQRDVWVDMVWHIKWSYLSDGVLEVWKDGVKIISRYGPNCFNDGHTPYFKCGEYKPDWDYNNKHTPGITSRYIYFDDIRIADSTGNYNSVKPAIDTPYITSISPTSAAAGRTIAISGVELTGATAVTIGGKPAIFSIKSHSDINAIVPLNATADYVTVTARGLTDTIHGFTYLPFTATISGDKFICEGQKGRIITFTGENGTGPYTFAYSINNGVQQTISTTAGKSVVTTPVSTDTTGTFVYSLLSVTDNTGNKQVIDTNLTYVIDTAIRSTTPLTICSTSLPYTWNGFAFKKAGTFTLNLTSSSGCDSLASLVLTVNQATSSDTAVTIRASDFPYKWNGQSYTVPGNYSVIFTNSVGCDSTANLALAVFNNSSLLVKLYPNPTSSTFNLQLLNGDPNHNVALKVVDIAGRNVYQTTGDLVQTYTFGQNLPVGVYILEIVNGKFTQHIRILKN